jgi:hypothetical protein
MRLSILFSFLIFFVVGIQADTIELQVNKDELVVEKGRILFEPDRQVRRAQYETYVFKRKQFETKVGKVKSLPDSFTLEVEIKPMNSKTYNPTKGQAPEGGIRTNFYEAKILKKK